MNRQDTPEKLISQWKGGRRLGLRTVGEETPGFNVGEKNKMARLRKIAKYGNADIIRLKPHDREDLGLDYDDLVDIDKIRKQKKNFEGDSCCDMSEKSVKEEKSE